MSRVFGIGLGRTGTRSLVQALEILGYNPAKHNPAKFEDLFTLRAGAEGAVLCHWQFLVNYFPEAKFICTLRGLDSWLDSSRRAMQHYPLSRLVGTKWYPYAVRNRLARWGSVDFDEQKLRDHYNQHMSQVNEIIVADRLMPFCLTTTENPWIPLCEWLDLPVPDVAFPWSRE